MIARIGLVLGMVSVVISSWALWRTFTVGGSQGVAGVLSALPTAGNETPDGKQCMAPPATQQGADKKGAEPVDTQMIAKVAEALKQKPEMILEAIESLKNRNVKKQEESMKAVIQEHKDIIFKSDCGAEGGNPKGTVSVVEFFDYKCSYCRRNFGEIQNALRKDGNIRVIYKEYPIFGPASELMSKAALAAGKQGKYAPYHQALMNSDGKVDKEGLLLIAEKLRLNMDQFKKDMNSTEIALVLSKNMDLGKKLNIQGTPAIIIGDVFLPGFAKREEILELAQKARGAAAS